MYSDKSSIFCAPTKSRKWLPNNHRHFGCTTEFEATSSPEPSRRFSKWRIVWRRPWKVCQLPGHRRFEVGIKENFAKGLRVCSLWWRCQFLLISIAFGEDRLLRFFSEERVWRKERKRGFTFARFLFTATPRHKRLARKKIPRTGQRTGLAFSLNWTFEDFFNYLFFMAAVCSGTMYTWEGKLIQIVVAVC